MVAVQMFVGAGCLVGLSTGWPPAVIGFGLAAFGLLVRTARFELAWWSAAAAFAVAGLLVLWARRA